MTVSQSAHIVLEHLSGQSIIEEDFQMSGVRILIIEDDVTLSDQVCRLLIQKGFYTAQCFDGEKGLLTALRERFDLILLDILLPSLNGLSLLNQLRQIKQTPVMMITASGAEQERIEGYRKGADDYNSQATITDGYDRDLFPHWLDEDGNCRDTRAETLILQSEVPVAFADGAGCHVTSGRWYDPYTNSTFTDDDDLDIDHIVPLKWAYEHGADKWPERIRAAFANDTLNVIAVSLSANRSKGAKGPTEWMPANQSFRCQYLQRFQVVTQKYQLAFTARESRVLSRQFSSCSRPG